MFKLSLRELIFFVSGMAIGLSSAAYFSRPREVISASPNFDSLATDLKSYPWVDIWHLCHEIDNESAGLKFFQLISSKYDEISDHKWPIPPDFIYRELADAPPPHLTSGSQDKYLLEIWSDGKRIRYAFRRWTPDLSKDEIVRDMNHRLNAWDGK